MMTTLIDFEFPHELISKFLVCQVTKLDKVRFSVSDEAVISCSPLSKD